MCRYPYLGVPKRRRLNKPNTLYGPNTRPSNRLPGPRRPPRPTSRPPRPREISPSRTRPPRGQGRRSVPYEAPSRPGAVVRLTRGPPRPRAPILRLVRGPPRPRGRNLQLARDPPPTQGVRARHKGFEQRRKGLERALPRRPTKGAGAFNAHSHRPSLIRSDGTGVKSV
jgi:hypothetical protein